MVKLILTAGSLSAFLAVVLGAFGAHALKHRFTAAVLDIFETGVKYQFYHAFALLITGMWIHMRATDVFAMRAGYFFITGTILFSLSLYLLAACKSAGLYQYNWLGAITPIGGLCFLAGWACLGWSFYKYL